MTTIRDPKEPPAMRPLHPTPVSAPAHLHLRRRGALLLLVALALATVAAVVAAPVLARHSAHVHAARNATLGKRIVVTARGRTLYTLSAERHGRFICTGTCLADWHPLRVPAGGKVEGVARLGTIRRPEGGRQATYRGRPLYTFDMDRRRGDVAGEGFRDVGVWHAAVAPRRRAHR
jgi:predicted lipoprotein with Yx(FWY)xxD motif